MGRKIEDNAPTPADILSCSDIDVRNCGPRAMKGTYRMTVLFNRNWHHHLNTRAGSRVAVLSLWLVRFLGLLLSSQAFAVTPGKSFVSKASQDFHTDAYVRKQVRFWETIFQRYDSSSVVIHDLDEPLAMIDVIKFDRYMLADGTITNIASSDQTELVKRYIQRYETAIERFAKLKEKALSFGPIEKRIFDVYQKDPATLARLYRGDVRLRGQAGLSDTFLLAAKRAQEYLPYMEQVFRAQSLPVQLTRLPFVESMFNLAARSKVGASGIWQFMPGTAREFMTVNSLVDERNNPYKATLGAAKLFWANYNELGSWPLAVTAYNHGRGGMARAVKEVGTSQLGTIISRYRSPSFGFASKNFYAEFLAASNTYTRLQREGRIPPSVAMSKAEMVALTRPMSVSQISSLTKMSPDKIAELNPCLSAAAISTFADRPLPRQYVIRLPKENARTLRKNDLATFVPQPKLELSRR